ncbi:hypothetical protein BDN72DRAFT_845367 [Pluteus cervinus]|uniref:Uncharacterized protein n=1 Tax=Pluteus cervinus TaxID=181527 RepID=A0ACD3AI63_9AGAR|nr:hypothetical protein BDN72DRAFT_845367 [Pluteus cervinus]
MSVGSPTAYLLWAILACIFLVYLIQHLWIYDRFQCLKWTAGRQPGAFKRVMTYSYLGTVPLLFAFSIAMTVIKFREGYVVLPGGNILPRPIALYQPINMHWVLPLYFILSVAWSLELVTHLEELTFWLYLLNQGPGKRPWFHSWEFRTWYMGSTVAVLGMPLTTLITRRNLETCMAWIFLAGTAAGTSTTICFLYVLARFPSFIRQVKAGGAEPDVVVRLATFYQLNKIRVVFRFLFTVPLMILAVDALHGSHPIILHPFSSDFLLMVGGIGCFISSAITLLIFFPRSITNESGYKAKNHSPLNSDKNVGPGTEFDPPNYYRYHSEYDHDYVKSRSSFVVSGGTIQLGHLSGHETSVDNNNNHYYYYGDGDGGHGRTMTDQTGLTRQTNERVSSTDSLTSSATTDEEGEDDDAPAPQFSAGGSRAEVGGSESNDGPVTVTGTRPQDDAVVKTPEYPPVPPSDHSTDDTVCEPPQLNSTGAPQRGLSQTGPPLPLPASTQSPYSRQLSRSNRYPANLGIGLGPHTRAASSQTSSQLPFRPSPSQQQQQQQRHHRDNSIPNPTLNVNLNSRQLSEGLELGQRKRAHQHHQTRSGSAGGGLGLGTGTGTGTRSRHSRSQSRSRPRSKGGSGIDAALVPAGEIGEVTNRRFSMPISMPISMSVPVYHPGSTQMQMQTSGFAIRDRERERERGERERQRAVSQLHPFVLNFTSPIDLPDLSRHPHGQGQGQTQRRPSTAPSLGSRQRRHPSVPSEGPPRFPNV